MDSSSSNFGEADTPNRPHASQPTTSTVHPTASSADNHDLTSQLRKFGVKVGEYGRIDSGLRKTYLDQLEINDLKQYRFVSHPSDMIIGEDKKKGAEVVSKGPDGCWDVGGAFEDGHKRLIISAASELCILDFDRPKGNELDGLSWLTRQERLKEEKATAKAMEFLGTENKIRLDLYMKKAAEKGRLFLKLGVVKGVFVVQLGKSKVSFDHGSNSVVEGAFEKPSSDQAEILDGIGQIMEEEGFQILKEQFEYDAYTRTHVLIIAWPANKGHSFAVVPSGMEEAQSILN